MIHTIFQGLLSLYNFLYTMVFIEWDIILADSYTIGLLYDYDLRVSDKKIIGFFSDGRYLILSLFNIC